LGAYDRTIRSLFKKEFPVSLLELMTDEKLSKEALIPLEVKLHKMIEREADLLLKNLKTGD
jgi:hypothetical protein